MIDTRQLNSTALAYIGDAVYELYVRKHLLNRGQIHGDKLHKGAIKYVSANGQAAALKELMKGFLTEDEIRIVKRGRNHKVSSKARGASPTVYKQATGFETLIGSLHLDGNDKRVQEIMEEAFSILEKKHD